MTTASTYTAALAGWPDDAPALADDRDRLTYRELRSSARQAATLLRERYGAGRHLLLRAPATNDLVVTLLGTIYSGNTPIPIDPATPADSVAFMAAKSGAAGVIEPLAPAEYTSLAETDAADPARPAAVLFTSGTSGFPKGVIVSHANLLASCAAVSGYLGYRELPSAAVVLPLHYSYALLSQVCCMLYSGGLVRLFASFRNPIKFASTVNSERLATFCGVPSTYTALLTLNRMRPIPMPGVRVICSAGAAMDLSKAGEIRSVFPNATFFNNYGMTEAAPRIAYIRDDDPRFGEPTCGRAMPGVEVKVVDPATHEELPDGSSGVLVVRGPNVSSGYLNEPKLTAEAFTRSGYLISGDIAYLDRGYIFIRGRGDDIFNVGGEKVAPLEIERLLNEHPAVEAAAVAGFPDELRGMVPHAFLKLREPIRRVDVLTALDGRLPAAKMPARIFEVSGFPMTANGKIQRRRLSCEDQSFIVREIT